MVIPEQRNVEMDRERKRGELQVVHPGFLPARRALDGARVGTALGGREQRVLAGRALVVDH
jgi:hypothetical protein